MRPLAALFIAFARMRLANMYTIACNAFAQDHSKITHPRAHSCRLSAAYATFEHVDEGVRNGNRTFTLSHRRTLSQIAFYKGAEQVEEAQQFRVFGGGSAAAERLGKEGGKGVELGGAFTHTDIIFRARFS